MKHDFQYVPKKQVKELKRELRDMIHEIQDEVREYFTFQYRFIGSAARDMVTQDMKSNKGFDFDINFYPNDDEEEYEPDEIRQIFLNAINKIAPKFGYGGCENKTKTLCIKVVDYMKSRIVYSCDFVIVFDCPDGRQQYIRRNKQSGQCSWEYQPQGYSGIEEKANWLKRNNHWEELMNYYLDKKNWNNDSNKKSRSLYAESIKEVCDKYML
jgi:hypothetical protein